jgi:hypothetical protein
MILVIYICLFCYLWILSLSENFVSFTCILAVVKSYESSTVLFFFCRPILYVHFLEFSEPDIYRVTNI